MKAMKIITTACWLITALVLAGIAVWFLTGSVFGMRSDSWNGNLFSGINISSWETLSGPFEAVGTYNPDASGVDSLNIDWIAGSVTIKPHDGNGFQVTEFAQRNLKENEKLRIGTSGSTLTINYCENGKLVRMPQKKLEVLVPRSLSENLSRLLVDAASSGIYVDSINADTMKTDSISGAIQISNSNSQTLNMDSASGSLTVENIRAEGLKINSISGAIKVSDSSARTLDCETASGSIKVSGAFDNVNFNSISGRIALDNSAPRSIVNTDSSSGSQELSGGFDSVSASSISGSIAVTSTTVPSMLKADTASGSVAVTVPNEGAITVKHSSASGSFSSDIPITMQNRDAQFDFSTISGSTRIYELK